MAKEKTLEERYQKKTQLEHILLRPESYVGSLDLESAQCWVWSSEEQRMVNRNVKYVPGMYKIFDEILVNAADVKAREQHENINRDSCKMTKVDVTIDRANGLISVLNDGPGIPVEVHKEHKVYIPELIFGHLLTSDNYDDNEARVTGGRNGYGAKLTNIFSSEFSIEVADSKRRRKLSMTWTKNMTEHTDPRIVDFGGRADYVKVMFRPDLKRFNVTELDSDLVSLLEKRVYDIAGTTGLRVTLNGDRLPIKGFKSYVDLYFQSPKTLSSNFGEDLSLVDSSNPSTSGLVSSNDDDDSDSDISFSSENKRRKKKKVKKENPDDVSISSRTKDYFRVHEKINDRWEIVVTQSDGQFQQVSFVNSICTAKGGTHVNYVVEPLIQAVLKKVASKNKGGIEIKGFNVRSHLFVFLNCLIVNPTFDSQTKETMTLKTQAFGSTCTLSDRTINAVVKSPITEAVLLWAQTKEQVDLRRKMKSSGGSRHDRILGIPKLEDANDAGTRYSSQCTLILTEGDSAKTSCVAGLSVVGKDRYGIFPLRGKVLNVRDATFKQLTENKEIQNILRITGLEVGKQLTDPRSLRYGSIMIMTDQDHDGSHIKGLLINLFQHYWPELLKHEGFLREFVTPIVKVSRQNESIAFLTIPEYEAWKRQHDGGKGWKVKYYKGLGTSSDKEFKDYFRALDKHQLSFKYEDDKDYEAIDMAFNSKRAEDRKAWIQSFEEGTFLDHREKQVSYKDFVNKELVLFSKYDTERSIPSVMDGWKPGQRKVLFGVFKKGLVKNEMKVAQLASFVAEHSAYHHGEDSLASTIVNMAQTFIGSNNLNVLEPCGQFGSRKEGGKDASATRYIYTKLTPVARAIFSAADEPLLTYHNEEGRVVEPKWYVPVIPLVLVNGAEGIGTGWSSSVPNHNPRDIIANLLRFLSGEPLEPMTPWYRGFKGRIDKNPKNKGYESVGIIEKIDDETVYISELPIRQWTQPYKEYLEELLAFGKEEEANASGRPKSKASAKGKAGARGGVRGGGDSGGQTTKRSPPPIPILDYRDNCTHESISFTVRLDPTVLGLLDQDELEKVFRMKKSIPTTNMTLFGPDGKVIRYESELDILREFAKVRLEFYHARKRHHVNALEQEKCLLSNKLKFITMVIEGDLIIQKKKRNALVLELRKIGFDPMHRIQSMFDTDNPTMHGDVEDDGTVRDVEDTIEDPQASAAKDYDYLLTMSMWNLTYEKVEELRNTYQAKEQELEEYKKKSPEMLWEEDLSQLEKAIDLHEAKLEAESAKDKISGEGAQRHQFASKGKTSSSRKVKAPRDETDQSSSLNAKNMTTNSQVLKRIRAKMAGEMKADNLDSLLVNLNESATNGTSSGAPSNAPDILLNAGAGRKATGLAASSIYDKTLDRFVKAKASPAKAKAKASPGRVVRKPKKPIIESDDSMDDESDFVDPSDESDDSVSDE